MNRLRWLALLMGMVIVVITGFQVYWLKDNYDREKKAVEIRANSLFHERVRQVQDSVLQQKFHILLKDTSTTGLKGKGNVNLFTTNLPGQLNPARVINLISQSSLNDSFVGVNDNVKKGMHIAIRGDAKYRMKDSATDLRIMLDSLRAEDIDQLVLLKSDGKIPSLTRGMDSSKIAQNPRNKEMISIANTVTRDSGSHRFSQINTIYFNNEKGEKFSIKIDSLIKDSIPVKVLTTAFSATLKQEKLDLPFIILRETQNTSSEEDFIRRPMIGSFGGYKLQLGNLFSYLIKQLSLPILFSFFLVGITIFSFILLYRSLLKQYRLGQIKNDLISNITHELKTPIATVGVAIEALKNFNAIQDPQRTREYLDISQHELQRLGLLVDKVLKLSMFEKKEIEVKYEVFDLKDVVNEVTASLRLQIEKNNARVIIDTEGDTNLKGDRLHMLSVVFNLLDNALKYSKGNAAIQVMLKEEDTNLVMKITDNGIGIPAMYKEKIFEKFFRVPTGDTHNAKGHGLGLSYIGQVVRQHKGTISVDTHEGIGSTFCITLPKAPNT